ncbi:MAG: iron ABC transporter permease [Hylemonella sp.]|nr:iron ABC transporter permease [Hylemonella sp.]
MSTDTLPRPAPALPNFIWRLFDRRNILPFLLAFVLGVGILAPMAKIAWQTVATDGFTVWQEVIASDISRSLLWRPLTNTMLIGSLTVIGTLAIGGFLAWLVVLTNVPYRKLIGTLAALPFVIPSFASAFAWGVVFRNDKVGGSIGWIQAAGIPVPDWLAWGMFPTTTVLILHYSSLVFLLVAAALASVHSDMIEAANMTGASRSRVIGGIVLPVVTPAIVSSASLVFAGAVSNFAAPALMGLPVNMHTLSTRLFGMISTGNTERGYVLALILIAISAAALWWANRAVTGRRSFATVTGKGGRTKRFELGSWAWPLCAIALLIGLISTVAPLFVLLASSVTKEIGSFSAGFTLHYWIGLSDPAIAQGIGGVLRDAQTLKALGITLALGACVAVVSLTIGLMTAYVTTRLKTSPLATPLGTLTFLPAMVPGIAFGAGYIALFGQSWGPIPALYGTFTLLVIAGAAYTLPFAVQSARACMAQVSGDIEDAATLAGASLPRRMWSIYFPLTIRGLLAGAVLVIVKMIRDLSLVVLLFTPAMPILSVVAYRYASEGFLQHANAITALITFISMTATILAEKLQGASQPWAKD